MKTRWTVALLLLLLPLTMAPKIALIPLPEDPADYRLQVTAQVTRTSVRAGTPVTTVFRTENISEGTMIASLGIGALLDGERSKSISFLGLSRACEFTGDDANAAICSLGALRPGQVKTVKITARPTEKGEMSFRVSPEILSGTNPHSIDANDVIIRVN